ncbi:hypothetical protein [Aquibium microcysteis]|uniref:hypothetical protein n=1 Tax=Aquibium microcysteis TaxID=675281 RepID=UPI00165D229A|nr:hypothetical protein [Aquibium microcysteis]
MLERLLPSRIVVMMILAGGLYLGPFLAGLSRQPPWTIGAFAAIMLLWSVLYRSSSWPRRPGDLAKPEVVAALVVSVVVTAVLASVFHLAGLGLSHIAGALPLPLPVALSIPILCMAAAVIVQSPRKAAQMDAFLDDALRQLKGFPADPSPAGPDAATLAVVRAIGELPPDAPVCDVEAIVGEAAIDAAAMIAAIDAMGVPPPRPALAAAVLIVTDPSGGSALAGRSEAGWIFDALRGDGELETLFAERAVALLAVSPHLWREMPYAYDVAEAAARSPDPQAARALDDLCRHLDALSRADDDAGRTDAV